MSQYAATFLGVSGSTAYALVKKPPKAMSMMILAGTAGATVDILIGWYSACTTEVELYNQQQDRMIEQKILESARQNDGRLDMQQRTLLENARNKYGYDHKPR
jgi:phage-related minor tail protein